MSLARTGVWWTVVVATAWSILVVAAPASAHINLTASDPEHGARLDRLPASVSLSFSGPLQNIATVVLTAPDGSMVADGPATVSGETVTQPVLSAAPKGQYALAYRVTSVDGHVLSGKVEFAVGVPFEGSQTAQSTTSASRASDSEESDSQARLWAGVPRRDLVVPPILLLLAAAFWVAARRTPSQDPVSGRRGSAT